MRPKTVDPSACRCCQARVLATGLSVSSRSDEFDSTPGPRHEPGATGELSVIRLRWMLLRRLSNYERMFECFRTRHADDFGAQRLRLRQARRRASAPAAPPGRGTGRARPRAPARRGERLIRGPVAEFRQDGVPREHRAESRTELLGDRAAEFGELHRERLTEGAPFVTRPSGAPQGAGVRAGDARSAGASTSALTPSSGSGVCAQSRHATLRVATRPAWGG